MNCFIVSGNGFLSDITLDENFKPVFKWVESIREAKRYTGKQARNSISKYNLTAFIWNPFKEEPIRGKWKVVRRDRDYDFFNDENHNALEWMPVKVMMQSNTDAKTLTKTGPNTEEYYEYEEAVEIARHKNQLAIDELILKNNKLANENQR